MFGCVPSFSLACSALSFQVVAVDTDDEEVRSNSDSPYKNSHKGQVHKQASRVKSVCKCC